MGFWSKMFGKDEPQSSSSLSVDDELSQIKVGMTTDEVIRRVGKCKSITTMNSALGQLGGFAASSGTLSKMSQTELWVYKTRRTKYKFFVTNGIVDEIKSGSQ